MTSRHRALLRGPGRWLGVTVAATVIALTASGCADGKQAPTSEPSRSQETAVTDPDTVLKDQANQLRVIIDRAAASVPSLETSVSGDGADACELPLPDEGWPQAWSYSRRVFFTEPDSRPPARRIIQSLERDGWTIRPFRDDDVLRVTAIRDGFAISIGAGREAGRGGYGAISLLGVSPCVNADGSLDRSVPP